MKCEDIQERVSQYLENGMDEEQTAEFRTHLEECAACSILVEELEKTMKLSFSLKDMTAPEDLKQRLKNKLRPQVMEMMEEKKTSVRTVWWKNIVLLRAAAMLVTIGLVSAVFVNYFAEREKEGNLSLKREAVASDTAKTESEAPKKSSALSRDMMDLSEDPEAEGDGVPDMVPAPQSRSRRAEEPGTPLYDEFSFTEDTADRKAGDMKTDRLSNTESLDSGNTDGALAGVPGKGFGKAGAPAAPAAMKKADAPKPLEKGIDMNADYENELKQGTEGGVRAKAQTLAAEKTKSAHVPRERQEATVQVLRVSSDKRTAVEDFLKSRLAAAQPAPVKAPEKAAEAKPEAPAPGLNADENKIAQDKETLPAPVQSTNRKLMKETGKPENRKIYLTQEEYSKLKKLLASTEKAEMDQVKVIEELRAADDETADEEAEIKQEAEKTPIAAEPEEADKDALTKSRTEPESAIAGRKRAQEQRGGGWAIQSQKNEEVLIPVLIIFE